MTEVYLHYQKEGCKAWTSLLNNEFGATTLTIKSSHIKKKAYGENNVKDLFYQICMTIYWRPWN